MLTDKDRSYFEGIIKRYIKKYPGDFAAWKQDLEKQQSNLGDKEYATIPNTSGNVRFAMNMPRRLDSMFRIYQKDYLSTPEKMKDFLTEFPNFQVPEKI